MILDPPSPFVPIGSNSRLVLMFWIQFTIGFPHRLFASPIGTLASTRHIDGASDMRTRTLPSFHHYFDGGSSPARMDSDSKQNMLDSVSNFFKLYTPNANANDSSLVGSILQRVHIKELPRGRALQDKKKPTMVVGHMFHGK